MITRCLSYIVTALVCSFFLFPFTPLFFPVANTKIILAALGGILFLYDTVIKPNDRALRCFLILSLFATIFSLWNWTSLTYHNSDDTTYSNYIVSMWVWFAAAYFVCWFINKIHGRCDIGLIANYMAAVAVFQCFSALAIHYNAAFKHFADVYITDAGPFMDSIKRLYGFGSGLDTSGILFSCTLLTMSVHMDKAIHTFSRWQIAFYIFAFLFITVAGNMMSRTTSVGVMLSIAYVFLASGVLKLSIKSSYTRIIGIGLLIFMIALPLIIHLYSNTPEVQGQMRFAFEGFFNWIERGEWETASTSTLSEDFYKWPTTFEQWIIGDGYFVDPVKHCFYKRIDMGYLRFIYYSGTIGLALFIAFLFAASRLCMRSFVKYKMLFILLLILQAIVWVKVAQDTFYMYALFICCSFFIKTDNQSQDDIVEKNI